MNKRMMLVLALAGTGCGPKAGPDLRKQFPDAAETLAAIEPRCRKPSGIDYEGCRRAAMMLASDAPRATVIFLATWEAVEMRDLHRDVRTEAAWLPVELAAIAATDDPELQSIVLLPILAAGIAATADAEKHHQAAMAAERITHRVLRRIYEANGDDYSRSLLPLLDGVRFESPASLAAFTTAHMMAMERTHGLVTVPGSRGGVTIVPPGSDATIAAAGGVPSHVAISEQVRERATHASRPSGKGPVPVKPANDRWKVVEAGNRVAIVTSDGRRVSGTVVGCSSRAIAVQPPGAAEQIVELDAISKLDVR